MRILVISNFFPPDVIGGYELACFRIAQALADQGHTITVLTSEHRRDTGLAESDARMKVCRWLRPIWDYDDRKQIDRHMTARVTSLTRLLIADLPSSVTLRRLLDQDVFDVVYLFNMVGLGPLSLLETLLTTRLPTVIHLMDNIDTVFRKNVRSVGLLSRFAELKSHFTAISCSLGCLKRNSQIGVYGQSEVVFGGIESTPPTGKPTSPTANEQGRAFRFGYTGQVVAHKGICELLTAFREVKKVAPRPVELHLIGRIQESFVAELQRLAQEEISQGSIVLHGSLPHAECLQLLQDMDVGVYPLSASEAFGYAPIECLTNQVPAIISRRAGCSEMLPSTYPFFLNRRENTMELTQLMMKAISSPTLCQKALAEFDVIKNRYQFQNYTLPKIETALHQPHRTNQPVSFPDLMQQTRFIVDYAYTRPQAVFNGC